MLLIHIVCIMYVRKTCRDDVAAIKLSPPAVPRHSGPAAENGSIWTLAPEDETSSYPVLVLLQGTLRRLGGSLLSRLTLDRGSFGRESRLNTPSPSACKVWMYLPAGERCSRIQHMKVTLLIPIREAGKAKRKSSFCCFGRPQFITRTPCCCVASGAQAIMWRRSPHRHPGPWRGCVSGAETDYSRTVATKTAKNRPVTPPNPDRTTDCIADGASSCLAIISYLRCSSTGRCHQMHL